MIEYAQRAPIDKPRTIAMLCARESAIDALIKRGLTRDDATWAVISARSLKLAEILREVLTQ